MDVARPSRKKEIMRRRILLGGAGVVALAAITWTLEGLKPAAREVDRAGVWIETVKRGEMLRAVRGPGTLVPEEIRWIAAETDGQVEVITIRPGATVKADDVILELTNPQVEQAAQDAELQLRAVEAQHTDLKVRLDSQLLDHEATLATVKADNESAKLQAEAQRELFDNGLAPMIELRRAELTAEQLEVRNKIELQRYQKAIESVAAQLAVQVAQVAQQRALYELRRSQLESLKVRAGIDGVLQQVPVEEGQRVAPGINLARVARPERLKAELRINETQARDVTVGQVAQIDTRNGVVEGRVSRIDPAVQQGTVTVDVTLTGELPRGARPDLSVDGTIELERLADVLYVGRPAYGQAHATIGLYKLTTDGESAQLTQVQLGVTSVNTVEVVEGLKEGDQVILSDTSQFEGDQVIDLRG